MLSPFKKILIMCSWCWTGQVVDAKDRRDRTKKNKVSITAKIICWLLVCIMGTGMLLYIYLFAMQQGESRQNAWFMSFVVWLCFEIIVVSSLLVLVQQVILPSLATRNLTEVKKKLSDDIASFNVKGGKGLSRGNSISEDCIEHQPSPATLNAAKYYFPSWRLASMYPHLQESALIMNFSTPWPNRTFSLSAKTLSKAYSRKNTFLMQAGSRIVLYLLVGLVRIPSGAQDVIVQLFIVSGMGYIMIALVKLYAYSPAMVTVPIVGIAIVLYLVLFSGKYRESEALRRAQNKPKVADSHSHDTPSIVEPTDPSSGSVPNKVHPLPDESSLEEKKEPDQLRRHLRASISLASHNVGQDHDSIVALRILHGMDEGLSRMPALVPLPVQPVALAKSRIKHPKKRRPKKRKIQPILAADGYYSSPRRTPRKSDDNSPIVISGSECDNDGDVEECERQLQDTGVSSCDEILPVKVLPPLGSAVPPRLLTSPQQIDDSDNTKQSRQSKALENTLIPLKPLQMSSGKQPTELEMFAEKLMEENHKVSLRLAQQLEERMAALEQSLLRQVSVHHDVPGGVGAVLVESKGDSHESEKSREMTREIGVPFTPMRKRVFFEKDKISHSTDMSLSPSADGWLPSSDAGGDSSFIPNIPIVSESSVAADPITAKITRQLSSEISRFFFDSEREGDEPDDSVDWEDAEAGSTVVETMRIAGIEEMTMADCNDVIAPAKEMECDDGDENLSLRPEDFRFDVDEVFGGGSDDEWRLKDRASDSVLPLRVTSWAERTDDKSAIQIDSAQRKSERRRLKLASVKKDKKREARGWVNEHESFESLV